MLISNQATSLFHYQIENIKQAAENLVQLFLYPQNSNYLRHQAGQYLEILYPDTSWQPFTIANFPDPNGRIELHIRQQNNDLATMALLQSLEKTKPLTIRGPFGKAQYRNYPDFPVLLIAGGSGFAYIKAIIEAAIHYHDQRVFHFFWGVKSPQDFYLSDLPFLWREQLKHFNYTPIVSQPRNSNWQGKIGYIYNRVLEDYPKLDLYQVYASGPMMMIRDAFDCFQQHGLKSDLMFSDML